MIAVEDCALILLAAGRSRRFGPIDKLSQTFLHKPLAMHIVTTLEDMPFRRRCAVVNGTTLDFAQHGYDVVHNHDPAAGMSRSVRMGVECIASCEPLAVMIVLADMPRVTAAHLYRLFDAADGDDAVVASSDGVKPSPPALFGRGRFEFLRTLAGDAGARDMVRAGRHVVTAPAELIDIDTPDDLEELRAIARSPETTGAVTRAEARRSD